MVMVLGAPALLKLWRNEHRFDSNSPPQGWPFGSALWRAYIRASPAGVLFLFWGGLGMLADALFAGLVAAILVPLAALLAGALVVSAWSIALFNRPRFLAPPHLREQPGAVAEWSGAPVEPAPPPGSDSRRPEDKPR